MSVVFDTRFTTASAIDGYEVVDERGRPVDKRATKRSANGVAYVLNEAARHSPRALAAALGCGVPKTAV